MEKPKLTNEERTQKIVDAAMSLVPAGAVIAELHGLNPVDMPNIFIACLTSALQTLQDRFEMPKSDVSELAQDAVTGLLRTLALNEWKVDPHKKADETRCGIATKGVVHTAGNA